jgi:phosphonate transport system substrate-binding protein
MNRGVVSEDEIVTIYRSATFPAAAYSLPYNLRPELRAQIEEAFATFPWEGSELAVEFDYADGFVPVSYQRDWEVIRTIARQVGDTFECQ